MYIFQIKKHDLFLKKKNKKIASPEQCNMYENVIARNPVQSDRKVSKRCAQGHHFLVSWFIGIDIYVWHLQITPKNGSHMVISILIPDNLHNSISFNNTITTTCSKKEVALSISPSKLHLYKTHNNLTCAIYFQLLFSWAPTTSSPFKNPLISDSWWSSSSRAGRGEEPQE